MEGTRMRVLITTHPEVGHWHPLVPLARALAAADHDVAFATTPVGCAALATLGFRGFPVGHDETPEEVAVRQARLTRLAPEERATVFWAEVFPQTRAGRMLPDLLDVVRAWRPHLVLREFLEFAGCVAAEHDGLPHAAVQMAAWRPRLHALLVEPLTRLRQSVGLPADPELLMPYRHLLLVTAPPSFLDPAAALPPTAQHLRPEVFDQSGGECLPGWMASLPERPVVYVTMGTVVNKVPGVLEALVGGLRDEPITVIVTTGRDRDPASLGPQPANVHLERYVPQSLLFPRCDLVVTHGGTGTVMAALSHGLPMVILPIAADQPDNAQRCVALGVARALGTEARSPEAIRHAVREVLATPHYREAAQRMREEIGAMPSLEEAVAQLQRLGERSTAIDGERVPLR
jgi:MGT family glycosyltransferase